MHITHADIERWTRERGEAWAYPHVQRVLVLAEQIAGDLPVQMDWFWYAAYLHDWGAFPCYRQPGVEHAWRSACIAREEILPWTALPGEAVEAVLQAIEYHDYRDGRLVSHPEAVLLREADFLDFLGVVGVMRDLAWGPNDLMQVTARIRSRMAAIRGRFTLPKAQAIAEIRLSEMETLLAQLKQESFGHL
jgi:uncharacterized protein